MREMYKKLHKYVPLKKNKHLRFYQTLRCIVTESKNLRHEKQVCFPPPAFVRLCLWHWLFRPCSQNSPLWSSKPKRNPLPKAEPFQPDFAHKSATDKLQQKLKSDKFRTIKKGVPQWSFFLPCGTPWCVKQSVILLFPLFYGAIFSISSFPLFASWFNPFHF